MNGYSPKNVALNPGVAVSGVVANQSITQEGWPIYSTGSRYLVIKIKVAAATVVGTITAKLQTAIDGDYVDSKTVVVSAAGDFYIKLNNNVTADQTFLPLLSKGRVVMTSTNAGDSFTVTSVNILQEL